LRNGVCDCTAPHLFSPVAVADDFFFASFPKVPCVVSATTVDYVRVGDACSRAWGVELADERGVGMFAADGKFHTTAKVWDVDRITALGL